MSQCQDPGKSAAAHSTHSTVASTREISTALPNAKSGLPDLPWTPLPEGLLEEELKKRKTRYTKSNKPKRAAKEREEAWSKTTRIVQQYSDGMIKRWNAEIDTYLVFAGLFSAVLTAFNVQSYILLQPETPDPTLLALQRISLQLSSFSSGSPPTFVNSTHPAFQQDNTPPPPIPQWAIWLNTLWFSSLILSLSSASIGIMVKQWLNEYASGISSESEAGTSRQTARLRQYRLNNLIKWHVGDIVNTIPVLLQVSLALFLAGLLVLLWTLHPAVAAVASVFAGLLGAFASSTVVLPLVKPGCAYLTPQSLALYHVFRRTPSFIKVYVESVLRPLLFKLLERPLMMRTPFRQIAHAVWAWVPVKAPTWHGTEQSIVSEESQSLDVDIIATAYNTAMNPGLLATAAICLSGLDPSIHVVDCIDRLQKIDENHFGVFPSPYICSVDSATGGPVLYDLWADSLLCNSIEEVKEISLRRRVNRVTELAAQIYKHFGATKPTLSEAPEQETVVRTVLGLSMAICHGACTTKIRSWHNVLHSFQQILTNCRLGELSSMNVLSAAAAAHQVLEGPPPDFEDLRLFCTYFTAVNIILECVLASHDVAPDHHRAILSYADHVLIHLTDILQGVADAGEDLLPRCDQYWLNFFVENLSDLVNIVTEEPAFPVRALFPADRIVALERALVAVQHLIVDMGLVEVESRIGDRAGYRETCEEKLVRLRALRSRAESSLQETTPPEINLSTPRPSAPVPGEPPATPAPVEPPPSPSVETAAPDSVEAAPVGDESSASILTLDPTSHAPVPVKRLRLATPRSPSHHGVPNGELHASPGSVHGGVISAPVPAELSTASVPIELRVLVPATALAPVSVSASVPASEPPVSVSEERPTLHGGGISDDSHEPSL